ncbi:MAG: DUF4178 domain-containing protein [Bacteroidales bacterium]|nr:DUF4178 domain-containing protein [Candidatus Scybalocola fimicaballi]
MDIKFTTGDLISLNGTHFIVEGRIEYSSKEGGLWSEYYLIRMSDKVGFWFSVDDKCLLWEPLGSDLNLTGYEKVEGGEEKVVAAFGDVDCDAGDRADYEDYFNSADNTYISVEKWSDGTEKSKGIAIDPDKIKIVKKSEKEKEEESGEKKKGCSWKFILMAIVAFFALKFCGSSSSSTPPSIDSVLSDNSSYFTETSLTGANKEFAQVYGSANSLESVVKDIITQIEGNTSQIYENPVDSASVLIVTPNEFCVVYKDTVTNNTLVHVCDNEWMMENSEMPLYHASACTDEFAKSLHIYNNYGADSLDKSHSSGSHHHHHRSYGSFFSGYFFGSAMNNRYNDYSSSVRQSSVSSRSSSGGGHGGWGK